MAANDSGSGRRAAGRGGEAVLEVRDLRVAYGGVSALRDVSIRMERGEIVALLGPNGAGKTTMARAITGMLDIHGGSVQSGSIAVKGKETVGKVAPKIVRAGVSQVLEGRQTVAELTVEENLRIGGYTRRRKRGDVDVFDSVLDLFPVLRKRRGDRAGYLSGGEQQMLVIGRAMMQEPSILLLDEPSLGLSPKMASEINELIQRINEAGTSVLLIEQNAATALELSSYSYLLETGEMTLEGPSVEVAEHEHIQSAYLGAGRGDRSYRRALEIDEHPPAVSAAESDVHLAVDGLTLKIGGVTALSDVSFDVRRGELLAVIGPNGAGKTSLLNSLSGFYRPQSGSIDFDGVPIRGASPASIARMGCARTFQNLALFDHLPVIDNVMVGRERFRRAGALAGAFWRGPARREERVSRELCSALVDLVGLSAWRDRPAGELSYGLRKRIELARALALEPSLLLLDEPVAGMNFDETAELASYVVRARSEFQMTVMVVEHDLHLVMDIADRILVMDFGHPIVLDRPEVVRNDPRVIAAYMGHVEDPVVDLHESEILHEVRRQADTGESRRAAL